MPTVDPGRDTPLRDRASGDAHAVEVRAALNRVLQRDLSLAERRALANLRARMADVGVAR